MDPKYLDEMLKMCENKDQCLLQDILRVEEADDDDVITLTGNKIFSLMRNILFQLNLSDILYTFILAKTL